MPTLSIWTSISRSIWITHAFLVRHVGGTSGAFTEELTIVQYEMPDDDYLLTQVAYYLLPVVICVTADIAPGSTPLWMVVSTEASAIGQANNQARHGNLAISGLTLNAASCPTDVTCPCCLLQLPGLRIVCIRCQPISARCRWPCST